MFILEIPESETLFVEALSVVPKEGWAQMLAFAGFLELVVNKKSSEPGRNWRVSVLLD